MKKYLVFAMTLMSIVAVFGNALAADDHGNTWQTATLVAAGSTTNGNIEMNSDVDYFTFAATAGVRYTIKTTLVTLKDSVLTLYKTNGTTVISSNDNISSTNKASRLVWACTATGTYFVKVNKKRRTAIGEYTLMVDLDADKDRYSKVIGKDCNDNNAAINPGATEVCDSVDNDCDSLVDEGCMTYYRDADADTYGSLTVTLVAISQPAGYVLNNTDCNDGNAAIHPETVDIPGDGIDQDCSGADPASVRFTKTYGGPGNDGGSCLIQEPDGGYLLLGSSSPVDGDPALRLIKTDYVGTVQWEKTFVATDNQLASSIRKTMDGGYIISGQTEQVETGIDMYLLKVDADGNKLWSASFGGAGYDSARGVEQTADGGYIILGTTDSFGAGEDDFYLVKTDGNGVEQWSRTIGGALSDYAYSIEKTADGGYILSGTTYSMGRGPSDMYVVKLDSTGTTQWEKTYGGSYYDFGATAIQTSDGGYIIVGSSYSSDIPNPSGGAFSAAGSDVYVVKTNASGIMQWASLVGGAFNDTGTTIAETSDGYVFTGTFRTSSFRDDLYLVKLTKSGGVVWSNTFGGVGGERASSLIVTATGEYVVLGSTSSYCPGGCPYLVKTDIYGQAPKKYFLDQDGDGRGNPSASVDAMIQPAGYRVDNTDCNDSNANIYPNAPEVCNGIDDNCDGLVDVGCNIYYRDADNDGFGDPNNTTLGFTPPTGYLVDNTDCDDSSASVYPGAMEICGDAVDQDCDGAELACSILFRKTYIPDNGEAQDVIQTLDGGYAFAGYKSKGDRDAYIVKTDIYGNIEWSRTFGGNTNDEAFSIVQTTDGGYVIGGYSIVSGELDVYVVKVNSNGNEQWNTHIGGIGSQQAYDIIQTSDGGYVIAGTDTQPATSGRAYLAKIDSNGIFLWSRSFGGPRGARGLSVQEALDGGLVMFGAVDYYVYLIKTDSNGNTLWEKTLPQAVFAISYSMRATISLTSDGGFILAGSGDVNYGQSSGGMVMLKIDDQGNAQWSHAYGSDDLWDRGSEARQTSDGGYILVGNHLQNVYLVKTDANGNESWAKALGARTGWSVKQTSDGGYIIGGVGSPLNALLIRTDADGNVFP